MTVLLAALGASAGAVLRFLAGHFLDRGLPWGTLSVNVSGSLLLGVLSGAAVPPETTALLGAGFCGGLTTYSSFAVQTHRLGLRRGALLVLLTVPPAVLACGLGHAAGAALHP